MSSRKSPGKTMLAEADAALYGLLENLLSEVESDAPPGEALLTVEEMVQEAEAEAPPELKKETVGPITKAVTAEAPEREESERKAEPEQVLPAWAGTEFVAMLFHIGKLKFAIPLVALDSIGSCPSEISALPSQPNWHLGVASYRGRKLVVVDLPRLLGIAVADTNEVPRDKCYVLVIGNGRFGLRCDVLADPVSILPERVRWSSKAPGNWLAGLLPDHMCSLLNPDGILRAIAGTGGKAAVTLEQKHF